MDEAIANGGIACLHMHSFTGTAYYLTLDEFKAVADCIAAKRDAGQIVVCTMSELPRVMHELEN